MGHLQKREKEPQRLELRAGLWQPYDAERDGMAEPEPAYQKAAAIVAVRRRLQARSSHREQDLLDQHLDEDSQIKKRRTGPR
jgi:hypothetical protein